MPLVRDGASATNCLQFEELGPLGVEGKIWMAFEMAEEIAVGDVLIRGEVLFGEEEHEMLVEEIEDNGRVQGWLRSASDHGLRLRVSRKGV